MTIHRRTHMTTGEQGYTLIELLTYVVMLGTLLTAVTAFFGLAVDARVKNQTIAEVNDQGTAIMDYVTQTIRNASSITTPAVGASGGSLTLVVPTGSLSPTVFDTSGSGVPEVKEGAGGAVLLANSKMQVSGLTFKNLTRAGTAGIVQVSFTLSRLNPNSRNEYDYQKTFTGSAEVGW